MRYRRNSVYGAALAHLWPPWDYLKGDFEGMRVAASVRRKSGLPLFAVRDDDDGHVRVGGPDIQTQFIRKKTGGGARVRVRCGGFMIEL